MTIKKWLHNAVSELRQAGINSAALDAEIILAHTLKCSRTYLHAHGDDILSDRTQEIANVRIDLRRDLLPVAYIIGHKEFYGRSFMVTPATLIPRPESEEIIELLHDYLPASLPLKMDVQPKKLVDIGTGSGCLGITAKLEYPDLEVTLLELSKRALNVAEKNATVLNASVGTLQSNLLGNYPYSPEIVLANLPYVDSTWDHSKDTLYEPKEALFAERGGLSIIEACIEQLSVRTEPGSIIILEADPRQWENIIAFAKINGFKLRAMRRFAALFVKY